MSKCTIRALEVLFVLAVVCPSYRLAAGGAPLQIAPEDYVVATNYDILVARVVAVSKHKATRANPPIVQLQVEETLRGEERAKPVRARWQLPFDPEIVPPDGPFVSEASRQKMREEAKQPGTSPEVGTKWIVLGDMSSDEEGPVFDIYSKYPFTRQKRQWVLDELARDKRFTAEAEQYRYTWPELSWYTKDELLAGARPVTADTPLEVGQPILWNVAKLYQCRVVEVLPDGRVKIRASGRDSRGDHIEPRDDLLLYSEDCLVPPEPLRDRYTEEDVKRYTTAADFIGIGEICSEMLHGNSNLRDIRFEVHEILKGKARKRYEDGLYYVGVRVPRELHFLLRRKTLYLLFLSDDGVTGTVLPVYNRVPDDDIFVEADRETTDLVKRLLEKQ